MQNTCKIAISIPKEDFEKVEYLRRKMDVGRSEIIDIAIRFWLRWIEQTELVKRYELGYMKKPEKMHDLKAFESAELEVMNLDEDWN